MADFFLSQNDTASPIFETLTDEDGNAVDIQGATVHIDITPIRGGTKIVDSTANNLQVGAGTDGSKGQVSYGEAAHPWGSATATAGDYLYRWTVTYSGGAIQGFPNDGFRLLTITPDAATTQAVYVSREELKKTLQLESTDSYADSDIDVALAAASRGLEAAYGTIWTVSTDTIRYYQAHDRRVILGDVLHATSVDLDYTWPWPSDYPYSSDWGSGDYSTPLLTTDYQLLPTRNGRAADGGNGEPYQTMELVRGASFYTLPSGYRAVRITGVFGWETVPAGVRAATTIIATRILKRAREAPFGVHAIGIEGATVTAQSMARDPEVAFAVNGVRSARSLIV